MKGKVVLASILFVLLIFSGGAMIFLYDRLVYPLKYEDEIAKVSEEYGVDSAVIASIINAESGFNENAISKKGAIGLMQVLPSTGEWVAEKLSVGEEVDLFDVETNLDIGTKYFVYLQNKFEVFETALCAYNAGEGTVSTWLRNPELSDDGKSLKQIPYKETENYVSKVQNNLKVYTKKIK